jgi:hypothetical protein
MTYFTESELRYWGESELVEYILKLQQLIKLTKEVEELKK